jgi:hydrogenase 3 maturation protease
MLAGAEALSRCLSRRPVLVGIGSRWHGDDAAGPAVLDRVAGKVDVRCIDAGDAPERHLGEMAESGPETVVLIDAVSFGGLPGEVAVFDPCHLPARAGTTHDMPLRVLMRYLEAQWGAEVLLVGIQPGSVAFGAPMSAPVEAAVEALAELLLARLAPTATTLASTGLAVGARGPSHVAGKEGGQSHPWM